ncbi:sphingomyelinase C-like [Ptychodera flava]|uniref:sphingomyelinase C-like n=1 Tax=Ptychodera flava TaxID=63121 RepID=UPI00396A9046
MERLQVKLLLFAICLSTFAVKLSIQEVPCGNITTDQPTVWLGSPPYCIENSSFCGLYGFEYVCSDPQGEMGTDMCQNGTKVLCAVPHPTSLPEPTPLHVFKVLSYNIYELSYLYYQSGQRERSCRIPFHVFDGQLDVDAIVWNEAFMGGCFPREISLRDLLRYHGFEYSTPTVGQDSISLKQPENGGAFIASRWPIEYYDEHIYVAMDRTTSDQLSSKGVMYAKINKTLNGESQTYHLFGTHMQAQQGPTRDAVRAQQAVEMYRHMLNQSIPTSEPVIYAGDFNADKINNEQNIQDVLTALDASMPHIIGDVNVTFDRENNDLTNDNGVSEWLDYVVSSNQHRQPNKATLQVMVYEESEPFPACTLSGLLEPGYTYPNSEDCIRTEWIQDLSDHYAVLGILDFNANLTTIPSPTTEQYIQPTEASASSKVVPYNWQLFFSAFIITYKTTLSVL